MWEDFSLALCRQGVNMLASWQWYVNRNCWVLLLKNPSKERGWLNWEVSLFFLLHAQKENAVAVVFIIEGMCWEWHNSKLEESRTLKQTDIKCSRKTVDIIDEGQTLKWKGFCINLWAKYISINPKLRNLRQENHELEVNPNYLGKICCNFFWTVFVEIGIVWQFHACHNVFWSDWLPIALFYSSVSLVEPFFFTTTLLLSLSLENLPVVKPVRKSVNC